MIFNQPSTANNWSATHFSFSHLPWINVFVNFNDASVVTNSGTTWRGITFGSVTVMPPF